MMRGRAIAAAVWVCVAATPVAARTYGESLLVAVASRHPGIISITIAATSKTGLPIALTYGIPRGTATTVPLADAMGDPVGTITVTGVRPGAADAIARDISRHLYVAANLAEPDPLVAGAVQSAGAQALVETMLRRCPDLVTLAFHVALPGSRNTIIASNFGRIGKPGDADDDDVIERGTIRRETTNASRRFAVELPLLDARGRVIGALSTSFMMTPGGTDRAYARALAVRAALARRITSLASLRRRLSSTTGEPLCRSVPTP